VIDQGDEGSVHTACVTPGEVGVGIVGIGFDLLISEGDGGAGKEFDAVADGLRDGNVAFGGEEGVVSVVSGVQEVLAVEFAKDQCEEYVADGDDALRMCSLNGFEASESAFIVEVVEVHEGVADFWGQVDGVGVGGGVVRLRVGRSRQQEGEEEAEDFYAAFYDSSPDLG